MNVIFFGLKRAYQSTLRVTRRLLARLGLTAARFDLLYIILKDDAIMLQCELRRALGVTAPTVSRMVTSLEKLGLVEREVMEEDRRRRYVVLTEAGRRCVRRAARLLIHTGHIQLAVDSALCADEWYDPQACQRIRSDFDWRLRLIRYAYRDHAMIDYPWTHNEEEMVSSDDPPSGPWSTLGHV